MMRLDCLATLARPCTTVLKAPFGVSNLMEQEEKFGPVSSRVSRWPSSFSVCWICWRSLQALLWLSFRPSAASCRSWRRFTTPKGGRHSQEIISFSPELREELLVAAALIPLTSIDFRLEASPHLVASDASTDEEAAVCCSAGTRATEELHRHALQKGLWNRLLNPLRAYRRGIGDLDAWEELPDRSFEELYGMHPVWEEIVSPQQFRQLGPTVRPQRRRHINIGEIRAAIQAEQEEGRLYLEGIAHTSVQRKTQPMTLLYEKPAPSCTEPACSNML